MVACGEDVLPEEAAPTLSFEAAARPLPIDEVFRDPDGSSAELERLAGYRMIDPTGPATRSALSKAPAPSCYWTTKIGSAHASSSTAASVNLPSACWHTCA